MCGCPLVAGGSGQTPPLFAYAIHTDHHRYHEDTVSEIVEEVGHNTVPRTWGRI